MKLQIKSEQLVIFFLSIYLFWLLPYEWYWFPILWIVPDIGMAGYIANPAVGSITYNLLHNQGLAFGIYLLGIGISSSGIALVGVIMIAHSSLDRVLGYGLKYADRFKHTYLDEL